jgi:hypothetical protein
MNVLLTILTILLVVGGACTSANQNKILNEFPITSVLTAEQVPTNVIIAPSFFTMQSKYLCTSTPQKDTVIDLFSTPDLKHIKSFGVKGKGGDEFQAVPMLCGQTNDYIYISGYTPTKIKKIHLNANGTIEVKNEYKIPTLEFFGFLHIVQDSLLLYHCMGSLADCSMSIKKVDLTRSKEIGKISIPVTNEHAVSFDMNRGLIAANDSFIVYPYLYKKQIDIYDVNTLKLLHRIKGTGFLQDISGVPDSIIVHYQAAYAGKNYFYTLYNQRGRATYQRNDFVAEADFVASQSLEVYDYDGNPIAEYTFKETIDLFTIDEKNGKIYAYNGINEDYFLRYNLSVLGIN